MKRDVLIRLLHYVGLKRLLARVYFHFLTFGVTKVKPEIKRILPHDPSAYTQGLAYYDAHIYESTGLIGDSRLRCIDPESGHVKQEIRIEQEWCEGITILENKLVQLTYTSGRAIVYDLPCLKPKNEYAYDGEGWGLTRCGDLFLMSNGSSDLILRNKQFAIISKLPVRLNGRLLERINALECNGDKIYANVQFDNCIYEIDRGNGKVLRVIDCHDIVSKSGRRNLHDMLNGIAYVPETETFYVTGKCWPRLFEIVIPD